MHHTAIENIIILADRQRRQFEPSALMELVQSIHDRGLMHPPVLRQTDRGLILVAGERRLKAIQEHWELFDEGVRCDGKQFPVGRVPYTMLGELSDLEAEEAELDENIRRQDLTMQERCAAVARLHALRQKQQQQRLNEYLAGMAARGFVPVPETVAALQTYSVADTAQELRGKSTAGALESTKKEIIIGNNLDNPEVAKAKSVDEAFKILKRAEEQRRLQQLGEEVAKTFTALVHTLVQADCIPWMRDYVADPANPRFDVILTDPPYGMGADKFGDSAGKFDAFAHDYDDSLEAWTALMVEWTRLSWAITADSAHAYVFCDIDRFHQLKHLMELNGWYVFRTPLTVFKTGNSGRVPLPDRGPRRATEWCLYAIKGNRTCNRIMPDCIPCGSDTDGAGHGAQKPVALYRDLLTRSVRPGDRVLDTFAGTGTIFPAAHEERVVAVGVEKDPAYFALAYERLQQLGA